VITLSGKAENIPYSLSRWTDVPAAKWSWMQQQLDQGWMDAIDQRTSVPARWSLKPENTLGLMFWTKDPTNLFTESRLKDYNVKVHVTATGWQEVEKGCPGVFESAILLAQAAKHFGSENVTWRFSPVPMIPNPSSFDVVDRFRAIASVAADGGVNKVFVSFLQNNDLMPETRSFGEKLSILEKIATEADHRKIKLFLCADDDELLRDRKYTFHRNARLGVCAPPEDYGDDVQADTCGCAFVVDPFTINESCTFGCQYCYAADKSLAPKKRNTTRSLPVVR
jgi:hypothetical protein